MNLIRSISVIFLVATLSLTAAEVELDELPVPPSINLTNHIPGILNTSSTGTVLIAVSDLLAARVPFTSAGLTTISNTTTETAIFTNKLPANILSTARAAVIDFSGSVLNNTGGNSNFTVKVYIGTTVACNTFIQPSTSANYRGFIGRLQINNRNGTASQLASLNLIFSAANNPSQGIGVLSSAGTAGAMIGTATEDSTAALPVSITVTPQHEVGTMVWNNYDARLTLR